MEVRLFSQMRNPIFDCGFEKSGKFHVKNDLWKHGVCDLGKVRHLPKRPKKETAEEAREITSKSEKNR